MKCIVFVLEVKDNDILNGVIGKEMLKNSFNECIDDISKHDSVCGETNNHKNQFDMFRVDIKHVFDICEAVTRPSKKRVNKMFDKKNPISSENNEQPESELTLVEVGEGALQEFQQLLDENRKTVDRMLQDHLKELFKDFHPGTGGSRNIYN